MQSIKLKAHVGPDGLLKLEVPIGMFDTELEVLVVVQPVALPKATTTNGDHKPTPEELGWPPGFFERTAGALADDPLIIDSEGDYEVREKLA
jgi:hypothetical protein